MNYLEILGLSQEPFSTSPDPLSYYGAPDHENCLHRLEISIRLRRGLNVVVGDIGTGKSTLTRCMLRSLDDHGDITTHLILDPGFATADDFARHLCELFTGQAPSMQDDRRTCVERLQSALYQQAVTEERTILLCIDEGQKLLPECLEVLRELLNYETNTEKLLQIVIFAQRELEASIAALPNFKDRINEYLILSPLNRRETIRLIRHRLRLAGGPAGERLFSLGALLAIHKATRGYPRRIMRLCHQLIMSLLLRNKKQVTASDVRSFLKRDPALGDTSTLRWGWLIPAMGLCAALFAFSAMPPEVRTRFHLPEMPQTLANLLPLAPPTTPQSPPAEPVMQTGPPSASGTISLPHEQNTPAPPAPPTRLGALLLPRGETVASLLETLYGKASPVLDQFLAANPALSNPNAIPAGTVLQMPAIPYELPPKRKIQPLIVLDRYLTLEEGYRALKANSGRTGIMLLPVWNGHDGLRFLLAVQRPAAGDEELLAILERQRHRYPQAVLVRALPQEDIAYRSLR